MTKEEEMKIEMLFMRIGNEIYKFSQEILRIKNEFMRKCANQDSQSECVRALESKTQTPQDARLLNQASIERLQPLKGSLPSDPNQIRSRTYGL